MPPDNAEIVRALWAAIERDRGTPWPPEGPDELDRKLRLDLCHEQIEIRNPPEFPVGNEFHGHGGVRQWAVEVWEVFSELHHGVEELIELDDGETVVSVQRTQGRMRHTDLRMNFVWAVIWTIRDGKALRAHGYMTKAQALEAAGVAGDSTT
ncbi:MAG: nuclear transport factor 2 family protein [Thermoleophilaceae bacterium]